MDFDAVIGLLHLKPEVHYAHWISPRSIDTVPLAGGERCQISWDLKLAGGNRAPLTAYEIRTASSVRTPPPTWTPLAITVDRRDLDKGT
jgi:hypothetical protein